MAGQSSSVNDNGMPRWEREAFLLANDERITGVPVHEEVPAEVCVRCCCPSTALDGAVGRRRDLGDAYRKHRWLTPWGVHSAYPAILGETMLCLVTRCQLYH